MDSKCQQNYTVQVEMIIRSITKEEFIRKSVIQGGNIL